MAVVVVVIGVGVCTVTDVKVNAKGFLCACVAVFATSLQQIVSIFAILSAHRLQIGVVYMIEFFSIFPPCLNLLFCRISMDK